MIARGDQAPPKVLRADYRPPDWQIDRVDLHFDIHDEYVEVQSRLSLRRRDQADAPLVLEGRHMQLLAVSVDGRPLHSDEYALSERELRIDTLPDAPLLEIHTRIDPFGNTALEGLYAAGDMLCTQCEAHGFSRITYFLDRPDVLSRYRVSIEADASRYPVLLSNGNRLQQHTDADGRAQVVWEDPHPKPCYLFALVAGDLACVKDRHSTSSGREVAIEFYVEQGAEGRCGHAIESLKQAMRWDEQSYGLEYDLDTYMVVAVSSFNMGAMENKGLNIFNDRFVLVSPETGTDTDFELVTAVIGHEYFHNWTGNRVTCRDWFQLSLKEGLTVFREQQFMEDTVGGGTQRIEQVRMLRERQFPEDAGPLAHPVRPDSYIEINNFYTATVYEKGAELVRMLQQMLGQPDFAKALQRYLQANDGRAATIEDFIEALQAETGIDLDQFFIWYAQAGTPQVRVSAEYDAAARQYRLTLCQQTAASAGQADKRPLMIPLKTALHAKDGAALAEQTLLLRETEQCFVFDNMDAAPVPALLRGFSAPIALHYDYSSEELVSLALHESDGFTRWEAMQRLYMRHLLGDLDAPSIFAACAQLTATRIDAGLLASLLTLPSENQLLEQAPAPLDPQSLLARRDGLLRGLGNNLADTWSALFEAQFEVAAAAYSVGVAARRSLRSVALGYLLANNAAGQQSLALCAYRQASNMTETLMALQALRDCEGEARDEAMADFRQRWDGQPLVLDKWLALQATTRFGDCAARVRQHLGDAVFSLHNPNRVRALVGAFALHNPRGLHARDGSGYVLFCEVLAELDSINPQVSARLAQALAGWQRYAPDLRDAMLEQMQGLLAKPGLSNDLYEILSKISTVTKQ